MILHFHEPPPAQKAGGIDAAIVSLRTALEKNGATIAMNPADPSGATGVHFHGLWQRRYPALAAEYRRRGIPYVVSPHGMLEAWAWRHRWWKKFPYWHLIEKRWVHRAGAVLATAELEAARLNEFLPHTRVETIPLGLTGEHRPDYAAARARLGWGEGETVLLYLSRIHEKKGLDLLLSGLAELHNTYPASTRLEIVGPEEQPAYIARCREFIQAHAARLPRITWHGAVWGEERWPYLQAADLFCLPSHSENFGLAVLESIQVGTPALTTTETPWATALADRGYIGVPTVEGTKKSLARFFAAQAPPPREALSTWAWNTYHWDTLASRYTNLYRSLSA